MARVKIADVDDFSGDGSRVIAEVGGQEIAVFRHRGEFYALSNFCIHQAGPLCEGGLTGHSKIADDMWDWEYDDEQKYISCPWHGWQFDITTGESVKDDSYAVPSFEVEVADGEVFLRR